jgi:hypothetical protein
LHWVGFRRNVRSVMIDEQVREEHFARLRELRSRIADGKAAQKEMAIAVFKASAVLTLAELKEATGLSHQRVYQLRNAAAPAKPPKPEPPEPELDAPIAWGGS